MVALAVSTFRQLFPYRVPAPLPPEPAVAPEPVEDDDNAAALPMAPRQPGEDVLFGRGTGATTVALFTVRAARRLLQERAHRALVGLQRGMAPSRIAICRKAPIWSNVGLTDYSRDGDGNKTRDVPYAPEYWRTFYHTANDNILGWPTVAMLPAIAIQIHSVTSHAIRRTFSDLFKGKTLYRDGTKSLAFHLLKQRARIDLARALHKDADMRDNHPDKAALQPNRNFNLFCRAWEFPGFIEIDTDDQGHHSINFVGELWPRQAAADPVYRSPAPSPEPQPQEDVREEQHTEGDVADG
ncbi:hypothetical protein DFQ27_001080, partial [Actinomortierella ambigua]